MRIFRLNWLFLAIVLFTASSCKHVDEDSVEFETLTLDRSINLSNEALSPTCTVSLKMANAIAENGHKAEVINNTVLQELLNTQDVPMQQAMEHFADDYIKTYKQTMLPLYNQDRADTTKRAWYEFHYIISVETQKGSKRTMSYLATVDYYEGGVHGTNELRAMNFDIKTGKLMKREDIFADGTENQLNNLLLKALKEKIGVSSLAELREKEYLKAVDIYAPENFIIGDETITFIYNPSEIAPYNVGATELIIPYTSLDKILKNSFITSLQ